MKEYTEDELRAAFYKGREKTRRSDGTLKYAQPTFEGYLRDLNNKNKNLDLIVKNIICEMFSGTDIKITPESMFKDDMGLDSVDVVELLLECEDRFNIVIPDDLVSTIQQKWTFGELVSYIEKLIKK